MSLLSLTLMALVTLALMLVLLEGLRRSGAMGRWGLAILIAGPLCFAAFYTLEGRHDCGPEGSPPLVAFNAAQALPLEARLAAFEEQRTDLSARLVKCGGSPTRWQMFDVLEQAIRQTKSQIAAEGLEDLQSLEQE